MKVAILKNPPRRRIVWPWVLLVSFLLFTVAPLAAGYILLQDSGTKRVEIQPNFTLAEMGKRIGVDSLDNVNESENIAMVITENDMDNILESALNTTGVKSGLVKKAYVNIEGKRYTFYIDLDMYVMRSRIKFVTNLEESEDKSTFVFRIKDMSIGMITGLVKPTKAIVQRFVNEQMVNTVFKQAGLSITFDRANYVLNYKKADIMSDINAMGGNNNMGLFLNVVQTLVDKDMANFNIDSPNFLDITMDLKSLRTNEYVTDDAEHIKVQHDDVGTQCRDKLVQLVNENQFDQSDQKAFGNNLKIVFGYLFSGGYDKLNEDSKALIDSIDFSTVGITDKEAYEGFGLNNSDSYLNDKMKEGLLTFDDLEDKKTEVTILNEKDLNNYIAGRNVIGFTTLMHRQTEESYKINYMTVDNFYSNIYHDGDEQIAEFVCKININGYPTSLTFVSTADVGNDSIVFTIKDDGVKYGEVATNELTESFFNIITAALNNGDSTISAATTEEGKRTITMHFTNIIDEAKTAMKASAETKYGMYGEAVMNIINAKIDELFSPENATITLTGTDRYDDDSGLKLSLKVNDFVVPIP